MPPGLINPAPLADGPEAEVWPYGGPYLFTADQFTRMVETRVFPDDVRLELLDVKVYETMAKPRAHSPSSAKFDRTDVCGSVGLVESGLRIGGWASEPGCELPVAR
jgi:hypothetical protein